MAQRTPVDPQLIATLERKREMARKEWLAGIAKRNSARSRAAAIRAILAIAWIAVEGLALWLLVLEVVDAFDLLISPTVGTLLLSSVIFFGIWTAELLGRSPSIQQFVSAVSGGLQQLEAQVVGLRIEGTKPKPSTLTQSTSPLPLTVERPEMSNARVSVKTTTKLSDGRVMTRESSVYRGDVVEARLMSDTDVSMVVTLDANGRAEVVLVQDGEERRLELLPK